MGDALHLLSSLFSSSCIPSKTAGFFIFQDLAQTPPPLEALSRLCCGRGSQPPSSGLSQHCVPLSSEHIAHGIISLYTSHSHLLFYTVSFSQASVSLIHLSIIRALVPYLALNRYSENVNWMSAGKRQENWSSVSLLSKIWVGRFNEPRPSKESNGALMKLFFKSANTLAVKLNALFFPENRFPNNDHNI